MEVNRENNFWLLTNTESRQASLYSRIVLMRRASSALVSPFAAATVCVGIAGSSSVLARGGSFSPAAAQKEQRRHYRWNVDDDLVPPGVVTSKFQSSNVPSERRRVLQEYAVAPLFGSRVSALLVGSILPPRQLIDKKKRLAAVIDDVLGLARGTIILGETRWLSDAVLPRTNSPDFRRLDSRTGETVASCLIGVYLPSEMDFLEQIELGMKLADAISGTAPDPRITKELAVTYCEFEVPDLRSYEPDMLLGEPVDPDAAMAALDRWMDRIQDQASLWEATYGAAKRETDTNAQQATGEKTAAAQ